MVTGTHLTRFVGLHDLLIERGPLQILSSDFGFPKTNDNQHFSEEVYMQKNA
jgi:hypothetical protein